MAKRKPDYTGILAKRIPVKKWPRKKSKFEGPMTWERVKEAIELDEEAERVYKQEVRQLLAPQVAALFDHFELPHGDWQELALKLAEEHVPGFQHPPVGVGPKRKWDIGKLLRLRVSVDQFRQKCPEATDLAALQWLRRREWRGESVPNLESRLQDAKLITKKMRANLKKNLRTNKRP